MLPLEPVRGLKIFFPSKAQNSKGDVLKLDSYNNVKYYRISASCKQVSFYLFEMLNYLKTPTLCLTREKYDVPNP